MKKFIKIKLVNYMLKIAKWTIKHMDKEKDIIAGEKTIKKLENILGELNGK